MWAFLVYLYTFSKNDVISSARKHYYVLIRVKVRVTVYRVRLYLGLGLGLAEIRFQLNVFSSKCSNPFYWFLELTSCEKSDGGILYSISFNLLLDCIVEKRLRYCKLRLSYIAYDNYIPYHGLSYFFAVFIYYVLNDMYPVINWQ